MRKFYLIANPLKEGTEEMSTRITEYLTNRGAVCMGVDPKGRYNEEIPADADCVITLGGDGTLIRAAKNLYTQKIPLLGINMGTLGYLTQVAREENIEPVLNSLLEDNYHLEYRMMLEGEVTDKNGFTYSGKGGIALNEIVVSRDGGMQPIHFELHVNGKYLNSYIADGIIIATPTGSTAYNLSAGGPIVTPGAELTVLTPICSHALNSRSIVLRGDDVIDIFVQEQEGQKQAAVFDGEHKIMLSAGRKLTIRRSQHQTVLIRMKEVSFLDNLRNKMTRI